jgi:beta-galactosidase
MEFWCGWFDHWQGRHHTRSADSAAMALQELLENDGSVNFYMFHGGTNFGFMNGANCKDGKDFQPTITSYDYDALLTENGDITPKYLACRKVISGFTKVDGPRPNNTPRFGPPSSGN